MGRVSGKGKSSGNELCKGECLSGVARTNMLDMSCFHKGLIVNLLWLVYQNQKDYFADHHMFQDGNSQCLRLNLVYPGF